MYSKGLIPLAVASVVAITTAMALIFFYAPLDTDQGFVQKIFYVHVPMAIVALGGFVAGGVMAIKHLRSGDRSWDLRSYVAIHMSIILGIGVLITGAIWAKASWGHWWVWDEPVLVSFLVVFLLYFGQREIVVRPLADMLVKVPGIVGATDLPKTRAAKRHVRKDPRALPRQ